MPVDPQIQALLDRGTGVPATRHGCRWPKRGGKYEARDCPHGAARPVSAMIAERSTRTGRAAPSGFAFTRPLAAGRSLS